MFCRVVAFTDWRLGALMSWDGDWNCFGWLGWAEMGFGLVLGALMSWVCIGALASCER